MGRTHPSWGGGGGSVYLSTQKGEQGETVRTWEVGGADSGLRTVDKALGLHCWKQDGVAKSEKKEGLEEDLPRYQNPDKVTEGCHGPGSSWLPK